MSDAPQTVVVGGGQAGLAASHELTAAGVPHVVLERGQVAQTWRGRWDSFCLVTPNWGCRLPGHHYVGDDPDGFMPRDEIVGYMEDYAASFGAPVCEGVEVTGLRRSGDGLLLDTSEGELEGQNVILSTGAYQRPHRPQGAASLPPALLQIDVEDYGKPGRASRRSRPRGRQRPIGLSDRRGAASGRPRRVPRLRTRRLGTAPAQRARPRVVAL